MKVIMWSHKKKLSKECAGIANGWPLLNKIVILMLYIRVWVLCECYIWTKNHVHWMSQIKTINYINNHNSNMVCLLLRFTEYKINHLPRYWYIYCNILYVWNNIPNVTIRPSLHKKWSFSLRVSSVYVTRSTVSCQFSHVYWRHS